MIKLIDVLREIEAKVAKITADLSPEELEKYHKAVEILQGETLDESVTTALKKLGLNAAIIAALMVTPELTSAQKAPVQSIAKEVPGADAKKSPTGTSVDGILGQYTSQFKFPKSFVHDLNTGAIVNAGFTGNKLLKRVQDFDTVKMQQWNDFVDWMKASKIGGKTISGNPVLDTDSTLGAEVLRVYRNTPEGKNFWVKDGGDIKKVQSFIKDYRKVTVADWERGAGKIELSGQDMDPKNPEHVKRVQANYMKWAKD